MAKMIRIMGVDPGSVITGYGIIETDGIRSIHIAHGHLKIKGDSLPEKLGIIFTGISDVIKEWNPQEFAIEDVFFSKNAQSALKLGQARGAAICAAVTHDLSVSEYSPRSVKQAISGTGSADKNQVQHMVGIILNLTQKLQADAADGLAISICHGHSRTTQRRNLALKGKMA